MATAFTYCPAPETLPALELTNAQFASLSAMPVLDRTIALQDIIDRHAFSNRKVIGLHGSVAPHGLRHYAEEFHAALPEFMKLANNAYLMASMADARRAA